MKKNLLVLLSLLVVASLFLAACSTAPAQESPEGFLGEATGPQTLGIQPKEGFDFAAMFNNDNDVDGGIMATVSIFGEVTNPPSKIDLKVNVDKKDYKMEITPGEQFFIPTSNVDSYFESAQIHIEGWSCEQREGVKIWDCKPR